VSLSSSAKDLGNQIPIHRGASSTRRSAGAERMMMRVLYYYLVVSWKLEKEGILR
jgi:hypothetical protein